MASKDFRHRVFETVDDGFDSDWYDKIILSLVVFSLVSVVIGSMKGLSAEVEFALHFIEVITVGFLTMDYAIRLWTADLKYPGEKHPQMKAVFSVMGIIDLLAFLPFYLGLFLPGLAAWNIARIIRALKLVRYLKSIDIIARVVQAEKRALLASLFLIGVVLFVASSLIYAAENQAQSDKYPDVISSFWWAIVTLTTVGYGDVFPITPLGKVIGGFLAISGIFIVAIPTGILSGGFLNELRKSQAETAGSDHRRKKLHTRKLHRRTPVPRR